MIKKFLKEKTGMTIQKIYKVDEDFVFSNNITINSDCVIAYFVDVNSTPGYNRFNMKQMLNVVTLDFSDLLKYSRTKKLDSLS